jgi:thiamine biosynthesis lipoprotein
MASPCEVLLVGVTEAQAVRSVQQVADEAWRVEMTFSRYRDDNLICRINSANGRTVTVDAELAGLLDYSATLFALSDGAFDITSGVLRRAWTFDGSDHVPDKSEIKALRPLIGWDKVEWKKPELTLKPGMEIDLGGIGKEYAVDRCADQLLAEGIRGGLVNFGGDIRVLGPQHDGTAWQIGVEKVTPRDTLPVVQLKSGAVATSGDARRYVIRNGRRYGHILDPRTGYPVDGAPRSVTVIDQTCTQAGLLATLAMLQGVRAERFLPTQGVRHHVMR